MKDKNIKNVLDHGYVRLANVHGTELDIVNAARLSYDNKSETLTDKDKGLIKFLVQNDHTSPLRHVYMSFEFYSPLIIARQHWRHIIGASSLEDGTPYSELSRRYVRGDAEFYIPDRFSGAPESSKQGAGDYVDFDISNTFRAELDRHIADGYALYSSAIRAGIAPEQARLFLPAYAMYTKYLWTPSLHAVLNFITLRTEETAQFEIREYAHAVESFVQREFPTVFKAYKTK